MKKYLLSLFLLLTVLFTGFAQQRFVTGKVISGDDNTPLPGVNVILKGTTTGSVTDIDGYYSVSVPPNGGTLIYSFVGMETQEVEIGLRNLMDVILSSVATQLGEVVILGYTTQSKRKNISSVSIVEAAKLENIVLTDVNQMLQGNAPGVKINSFSGQPGAKTTVRIRGTNTLTAGRDPLYVVDGIITNMQDFTTNTQTNDVIANLNPNDIASITVLKDAIAQSLYGARASNGVIVITTKSGKAGKTKFTVTTQYGVVKKNDGNFKMMDTDQAWDYERDLVRTSALIDGAEAPFNLSGAALDAFADAAMDQVRPLSLKANDTDWVDLAFDDGKTQKFEFTASGGSESTTFFMSAEYFNQDGILFGSEFDRYSLRANIKHQSDKFDFALNFNPSYTNQQNATDGSRFASPLAGSFTSTPFQSPYDDETGELLTGREPDYIGFTGDNFLYSVQRNPVINNNSRLISSFTLGYQVMDNLRVQTKGGIDFVGIKESSFFDPSTNDGFNLNGQIDKVYDESITYTTQTTVSGSRSIGSDHNLDGLAVFEYQNNRQENFSATGVGLASGKLKTLSSTATPLVAGGGTTENSFVSVLGMVNYNFNEKYFATFAGRRDWSSRFGANNRGANFWSAGFSWRIIEESFISNIPILSDAKLRVSYGSSGNAFIGDFETLPLIGFGPSYSGIPGSAPIQIANPDLTWEVSDKFNVGLDFGVFGNKITGTIEYYDSKSRKMLLNVPVSSTSGFTTARRNVGELRNSGIEAALSSRNLTGELTWTTDFNIAFNNNEILKLPEGKDIPNGSQLWREGKPHRIFFIRQWAGVNPADGTPLWNDGNGGVTGDWNQAKEVEIGNAEPDFTGGITNTLSFKGITLSAFFYFSVGNEVYNASRVFIDSDGSRFGWNHVVEAFDRWQQPGDIATRPQAKLGGNNSADSESSRYLEDGSYLRLRNLTIGYSLPSRIINNLNGLMGVRIYLQGQNLWTLTDYSGFDPEMGDSGFEFFRFPNGKSYTFGIEVGF